MARALDRSCPGARTLDLIGERWTLLVLRDLVLHGPRRYQDFQESLEIAPNTLSARLKSLEAAGLAKRELYSEHPPRPGDDLTGTRAVPSPLLSALPVCGISS